MILTHPLQISPFEYSLPKRPSQLSGGFFEDLFDFGLNAISGLFNAVSDALDGIIHTVVQIFNTVILIVEACIGQADWNQVWGSLGKTFQLIGNVAVTLNPLRISQEVFLKSNLTASVFTKLDQFTGGALTTTTNISDLVFRTMRGDPISKAELLKDAIFALKVVAVVFGGPLALGVLLGTMVGNVACKELKDAANTACKVGIAIVAAASAQYAADTYGLDWTADEGINALTSETESLPYTDYMSQAATKTLENKLVDQASLVAVGICQQQGWAGKPECGVLGQIAADYVKSPDDMDWPIFLGNEAVKIGVGELLKQWYPQNSREHKAIQQAQDNFAVHYVTGPDGKQTLITPKPNIKPLLAVAAAGVGLILVGGS